MIGKLIGGLLGLPFALSANKKIKNLSRDQERRSGEFREKSDMLFDQKFKTPEELSQMYKMLLNKAQGKSSIQQLLEERSDKRKSNRLSQLGRLANSSASAILNANQIDQEASGDEINAILTGEQSRDAYLGKATDMSTTLAQYKKAEFDYNVVEPRNMFFSEANALKRASGQNYLSWAMNRAEIWQGFGNAMGESIDSVAKMALTGGLGGGVPTYG